MEDVKKYIEGIELTETEKINFFHSFNAGHFWGLKYLEGILNERATVFDSEDIHDVMNSVLALNGMVAMGETFTGVHSNHYDKIYDLYQDMLGDLFCLCGITDEDCDKWSNL